MRKPPYNGRGRLCSFWPELHMELVFHTAKAIN